MHVQHLGYAHMGRIRCGFHSVGLQNRIHTQKSAPIGEDLAVDFCMWILFSASARAADRGCTPLCDVHKNM